MVPELEILALLQQRHLLHVAHDDEAGRPLPSLEFRSAQ